MHLKSCFVPLLAVTLFASCSKNNSSSLTSQYVLEEEQKIALQDCLSKEEEKYLVFFHSETCNHCKEIMGDVFAFASADILPLYFLDIGKTGNEVQICKADQIELGVDNVGDLFIVGTPTIVKVENGITTANVAGKEKCLTLLNQERMNSGNQNTIA